MVLLPNEKPRALVRRGVSVSCELRLDRHPAPPLNEEDDRDDDALRKQLHGVP